MSINYKLAGEYADRVQAIFMTESHEFDLAVGDSGQALGPGQMHPSFFQRYYGKSQNFPADNHDTWNDAWVKACASYFEVHENMPLDLVVQAYNRGIDAVFNQGIRNPEYLAKFTANLNKIHGMKTT